MGGGKGSEVRGKRASEEGGEEVMEEERVESGERLPGRGLRAGRGPPQRGWQELSLGRAVSPGPCPEAPALRLPPGECGVTGLWLASPPSPFGLLI